MDKSIIKHYRLTEEKESELWKNAVFVFDSSAILDFYFLPKTTRAKIYSEIFENLPNRLWIPFHVQFEYLKNREKNIKKPISEKYDPIKQKIKEIGTSTKTEILKKIEEIARQTHKDDKHPYIEQIEIEEFKKNVESFISQIKTFEDSVLKKISNIEKEITDVEVADDLLEALESFFEVGREFSFDEIIEITKEGKHRYEYKIPPGYGDLCKKEKKGTQIFGDLIIWKQILEYSKDKKLPVIFITNDIKKDEDWCYLDKKVTEDRIHSPREELIKEIKDYSNVDFWMYNLPQFLYHSNKYLKATINEETIQNISQFLNTKYKKSNFLRFKCDNCGRVHQYNELDFDLEFECVGGSERNMGTENQYQAQENFSCKCGNEITATFEVWEYPLGIHNYDSLEMDGAELLETFYFTVDFFGDSEDDSCTCHICDGNKDNIGKYVNFWHNTDLKNEYDTSSPIHKYKFVRSGECSWCNTLHIKCPRCKFITAFPESENDKEIDCEGGCGLIFYLDTTNDTDNVKDFSLRLIDHRKKKCSTCDSEFVDLNGIGVCEKCDLKLDLE